MNNKSGFTLAEVLITLGIIGVVAAMTIPTLMANTTASQFKTAFKKTVSNLKQAITMNVALDDYDLRVLVKSENDETPAATSKTFANIIVNRFEGAKDVTTQYFGEVKNMSMTIKGNHTCVADDLIAPAKFGCTEALLGKQVSGADNTYALGSALFKVYQMADGTVFGYDIKAADCITDAQEDCVGFIDTNGIAGPNKFTECDDSTYASGESCIVSKAKTFDIYPVVFYNQSIDAGSTAARSVLMSLNVNKNAQ